MSRFAVLRPRQREVRLSRWRVSAAARTFAAATGLVALGLLVHPLTAQADRNNYYKYTDENGVLHVTNVPRAKQGDWKLWRSVDAGREVRPRTVATRPRAPLSEERIHRYDSIIEAAAARYQLPEALVRAVIHTESSFEASAVSPAGAQGLMQLMPATARALGVRQPFDPEQNIHGGARYLRLLANRYQGDMVMVLAAYNAGAGNVAKYGGVPPFAETQAYVRSVLRRFYAYERQAKLGQNVRRRPPARNITP